MFLTHVSPERHVVNAPFRECEVLSLDDPNVSVRRIEASFRKRGNSLSGNPCLAYLLFAGFVGFSVGCSVARGFFSCRFSCLSFFYWYLSFLVQGVVCVYTATMGRIFGPGKGMSSTTLPCKRRAPTWIKLKPEDLSEQFYKMARKGITPSSFGVTLCSFGVAQLEMFTSIKFLRFLKKKGLAPFIPEDLVEKDVSMQLPIEEPVEPD